MPDDNEIRIRIAAEKLVGQICAAHEIVDSPRTFANEELRRVVMDWFGHVEPYVPDTDDWRSMPLRLAHDQGSDWYIELGPYDLDRAGIELLRRAIAAYDQATGR
ncbi:hypothetical protein A5731_04695 [Mycolicibacterium conceptionense]|uniref:Uncharacterized protein n=1 Tax=Mycolicibacterium conceptionense TaxID=451644 RepID=A0A1A2UWM2_9MYCO|nr:MULTISPECIES: hypothetical protein [Mycolicibacterium]MCW1821427.1 hypothetical protein [Mycolicibacterium senegalense]OBB07556.1 hypothetical protein A5718_17075 [Mycolicibacterium conceptionense]OBF08580.1 hypothetical protein A5731_04695 [Mycolicibacterium conceptionense]OBF23894.1 hypothetical protein A5726_10455 [Mycolicibacterium conceptionense]OBF32054.1 hypothetical protein A5720_27620 [Mycolicibacterium conceptionense]